MIVATLPKATSTDNAAESRGNRAFPASDPALLTDLQGLIRRHMFIRDDDALLVAAWALFTHTLHHHKHSPRLFIWSPTYGCGKTTMLDILSNVVRNPFAAVNATEAVLFRVSKLDYPTMLLDEADTWLRDGNSPMMGVLNSGFGPRSLAWVPRMVKDGDDLRIEKFETWGALAIASRGRRLDGGMVRRSIAIDLEKAPMGKEPVAFATADVDPLMARIAAWAAGVRRMPDPPVGGVKERDTWRPLLAIADCFGELDRMTEIAKERSSAIALEENVALLLDLKDIFGTSTELHTDTILEALEAIEESPWAAKLASFKTEAARRKWLADSMRAFKIKPEKEAFGGQRKRGYRRARFETAWDLYTPEHEVVGVPVAKAA